VRPHVGGCSLPTVVGWSRGRDEVLDVLGLVVVEDAKALAEASGEVDEVADGEEEINIGSTKHCSAHS
jgi:hypothetical protein